MKNKTLKRFVILFLLLLSLVGCSKEVKEFQDNIIPATAELGQEFPIDSKNTLKINDTRIIKDGENKVLIVNYSWENGGNSPGAAFNNLTLSVLQDGAFLVPTLEHVENAKKLVTNIDPGEVYEGIEQGFILYSDNPVTISIMGNEHYWIKDNKPLHAYPVELVIG